MILASAGALASDICLANDATEIHVSRHEAPLQTLHTMPAVGDGLAFFIGGEEQPIREYIRMQQAHHMMRKLLQEQAVLQPGYFTHVLSEMNNIWEIPAIEYMNNGGGYIFGLPVHTELPAHIDILEMQDDQFRWAESPEERSQRSQLSK